MRIKCTDTGKWIGSKGECVPQTCPALQPPKNGQIEPKSCSEGSFLNFYHKIKRYIHLIVFHPLDIIIMT
jgi:hypothetical protein